MKHSEIVGLSFFNRVGAKLRNYSDILTYTGTGLLSLLLSCSVLFAQTAPFGVAVAAAAVGDQSIAAVLGAVLGYLIAPGIELRMKYIAAVLVIGAVKWAVSGRSLLRSNPALSPLLAAVVLAATGGAILMTGQPVAYDFILLLSEILLAAGATFFFARTLALLERPDPVLLRQSDLSCAVITFGLLVVAFCSFSVGSVSIGRTVAVLIILVCALKAGEAGGAVGGVAAGVAACLSDYSFAFLMGAYGFGGLMAGVFSPFGRFGCAAAFIITNGVASALAALVRPVTLGPVLETFLASVVFILLPQSLMKKMSLAPSAGQAMSADSVKNIIVNRLMSTRRALDDISAITEQVAQRLQKLEKAPFDIQSATAERVCKECPCRLHCWQKDFNTTSSALSDLSALIRRGKTPTVEDISEPLRTNCKNPQGLLSALCKSYSQQRQIELGVSKSSQLRSVVLDQWKGIERLIGDISADIARIAVQNEHTSSRVREYLIRRGISFQSLSCYEDNGGHMVIEMSIHPAIARNLDRTELSFDFSEICERDFSLPDRLEQEEGILLIFHERPVYRLCSGVAQACSTGKRLCGDSFKFLEESDGRSMVILSDGMGSGSLAAIDSSMATALIGRLASAQIGLEAALKLVNSAMLVKSGDESLATVDICLADLYNGSVTLYKAGAAPSYIRKGGRVGYVESSSLPAGILNSIEFEKTTLQLDEGDIVVLVSDGVTQTGEDWVLDELERFNGSDMQWFCDRISTMAKLRRTELHDDDITVFALQLHKTGV
ncbi:MAG: SpoIIE family protein phosphatase [Provencibacterium sp.]|nr:SpoIIE family protein phosphatase [Provencibacterium sp.]